MSEQEGLEQARRIGQEAYDKFFEKSLMSRDPVPDAKTVASFYNTLVMEQVPEAVAKEAVVAYIASKL